MEINIKDELLSAEEHFSGTKINIKVEPPESADEYISDMDSFNCNALRAQEDQNYSLLMPVGISVKIESDEPVSFNEFESNVPKVKVEQDADESNRNNVPITYLLDDFGNDSNFNKFYKEIEESEYPKVLVKRLNIGHEKVGNMKKRFSDIDASLSVNETLHKSYLNEKQNLGQTDQVASNTNTLLFTSEENFSGIESKSSAEYANIGTTVISTANKLNEFNATSIFKENIGEKRTLDNNLIRLNSDVDKIESPSNYRKRILVQKVFNCYKCKFKSSLQHELDSHALSHSNNSVKYLASKNNVNFEENLKNHALKPIKQLIKCKKLNCGFETSKCRNMLHHLKNKCRNTFFECAFCDYETVFEFKLISHDCKRKRKRRSFKCFICKKLYMSRDKFRFHLKQHYNKSKFSLDICIFKGKRVKFKTSLQVKKSSDLFFTCLECKFVTKYKNILKKHVLQHSKRQRFLCKSPFEAKLESKLKTQMKKCSDIYLTSQSNCIKSKAAKNSDNGPIEYKCSKCTYVTIVQADFNEHSKAHNDSKYKCLECNTEYDNELCYAIHLRTHSPSLFLCSSCGYKTSMEKNFDHHIQKHKKKIFRCSKCKYNCLDKKSLEEHLLIHYEGISFECPECSFLASVESHLKDHIKIHLYHCDECDFTSFTSNGKKVKHVCLKKCPLCEFKSIRRSNVNSHMKRHTIFRYKCSFCEYKVNDNELYKIHLSTCLKKCSECEYKTHDLKKMRLHKWEKHAELYKYKCQFCEFRTNTNTEFQKHLLTHLEPYRCSHCNFTSKTKKIVKHDCLKKCSLCEYKTYSTRKLSCHKMRHAELFKHKCSFCKYNTNDEKLYGKHMSNHAKKNKCPMCNNELLLKSSLDTSAQNTEKKILKCSKCAFEILYSYFSKTYLSKGNLRTINKRKCSECNFECVNKNSLKIHIAKHAKVFPYKCTFCEYKTADKFYFKRHMDIHSDIKKFMCSQCDFSTKTKTSLDNHMAVHRAKKLYKCDQCDYESNFKHNLRTHVLKHTTVRMFNCDYCEFTSNYKFCIERHIQVTHERADKDEAMIQETLNEINKIFEPESKEFNISVSKKEYKCPICDYTTCFIGNLRLHKQTSHRDDMKEMSYSCSHCKYVTKSKASLELHNVYHLDETNLKCFYCDFTTESKTVLRTHVSEHQKENEEREKANSSSSSKEKRFNCESCSYASFSRVGLNQHKKTHLKVKGLKCHKCQYATNFKGNLDKHIVLKHSK